MSAISQKECVLSPEEYLEGERFSQVRHEYLGGDVYAMAGASADHNRISGNIFSSLQEQLRRGPCEAFIHDMKVRIQSKMFECYYYPDVLVSCDPGDNHKYFRERPSVIIEVLSPETLRVDEREKRFAYWDIPTLQTYVLVAQDRIAATVLGRTPEGWKSESLEGPGSVLKLPEIGAEIVLSRVYERTSVA